MASRQLDDSKQVVPFVVVPFQRTFALVESQGLGNRVPDVA
jgi:hypothetical protein